MKGVKNVKRNCQILSVLLYLPALPTFGTYLIYYFA